MYLGMDSGSISVKLVAVDADRRIVEEHYRRHLGHPVELALELLRDELARHPQVDGLAVTGSGGKLLASLLGAHFVNEVSAQALGTATLHPEVRTIIEVGGEDTKLIGVAREDGVSRVVDFAMNAVCAAGTGSFLDQQAARLGINIEGEFGELAERSAKPPRVAGRCTVFAKSDMIHLQQEATPLHDILAGLCHAMARNFLCSVATGKGVARPVAFQGGVAANRGMIRAFEDELELAPGELFVPPHHATMGAIGAVFDLLDQGITGNFKGLAPLEEYLQHRKLEVETLAPLVDDRYPIGIEADPMPAGEGKIEVYIGVDVGSISTNVVVIDRERHVLARKYLMTAGRPLEAVRQALLEVGREIGDRLLVKGACTTGSGRHLTGAYIGADVVKNEITTHARAAVSLDPTVDTIFEIGGQDAKYISLADGVVVDFTMNKVCAAGTGSFLEEQAERLSIRIEDFGELAFTSKVPIALGERCTVFMESALSHHLQRGAAREDLAAGLCYSVVQNYLHRVVEDRTIGNNVFFQGGTAYNRGVKAAFEKVTGRKITVPPHHDVLGALGAALIALENSTGTSTFKGFDLAARTYQIETFECRDCANHCEIRKVTFAGESPLMYGSRCGKFDQAEKKAARARIPNPFRARERLLLTTYKGEVADGPGVKTVGIPRAGTFYECFPLYQAFFSECGFKVVVSDATNQAIIKDGLECCVAEHCFPIKAVYGHVLNVLAKKPDYLFLPTVINMPTPHAGLDHSWNCPYVEVIPSLVRAVIPLPEGQVLSPIIHLRAEDQETQRVLVKVATDLGVPKAKAEAAAKKGLAAQQEFYRQLAELGRELLASLKPNDIAMVLIGRPYNSMDMGLNLRLPEKLIELGVVPIPIDFLPLADVELGHDYPRMYWRYGQRIIAAAKYIATDPRLDAAYLTNFGCGPDSFITKYFAREMRGKPFLSLEIDEHSADVGMITRCEAFLDSARARHGRQDLRLLSAHRDSSNVLRAGRRKMYVPYMDDHGYVLGAAFRANGIEAECLPMANEEAIVEGRRHTSGKECYPCIVTCGDLMKLIQRPDFDPDHSAFLFATANGPCRFGQYCQFQRILLDKLGLENFPVVAIDQATTGGFARDTENFGNDAQELMFRGIVMVDLLQKVFRHVQPYEVEPGSAERTYRQSLQWIVEATERREDLGPVAERIRATFAALPVDQREPRPRIGLVGEIYVRSNPFANNFIVRKLQAFGAEVTLPPLAEWLNYINYERRTDAYNEGHWLDFAKEKAVQLVLDRVTASYSKPFKGLIRDFLYESPTKHVLELAGPYLDYAFRGEAILSMGRLEEYAAHGYDGVVNTMPFNCLPGTIVNVLLEQFRRRHPEIPILKMSYDGFAGAAEATQLEAFYHQCRTHLRQRLGAGVGAPARA